MQDVAPHTPIGQVVAARYRIERMLGEGGVGVVYECFDLQRRDYVAVKLLHPEYARDRQLGERFEMEARLAARLEHPNIVRVLDVGKSADGNHFLVMELLRGVTLGAHLKNTGAMSLESTASVLDPIMDALAYAHGAGVVHRDLKPDNIFFAQNAGGEVVVKLLDFGLAKSQRQQNAITRSGQLIGTPSYMAPEQIDGEPDVGPRADVWAMGLVFLECMLGRRIYNGPPTAVVAQIMRQGVFDVAKQVPVLPREVAKVMQRAVQHEKKKRFANAGEMLHSFQLAMAQSGFANAKGIHSAKREATLVADDAVPWSLVAFICVALIASGGALYAMSFALGNQNKGPELEVIVSPTQRERAIPTVRADQVTDKATKDSKAQNSAAKVVAEEETNKKEKVEAMKSQRERNKERARNRSRSEENTTSTKSKEESSSASKRRRKKKKKAWATDF